MSLDTLVQWIQLADLEAVDPAQVRGLVREVREAREGLLEEDPLAGLLDRIEAELWDGAVPGDALRELAHVWSSEQVPDELPATLLVEEEIRLEAARLADPEWNTTFYLQALQALGDLEGEDVEGFSSHLGAMRERVLQAWELYAQTPLLDEEVTAETTAGHRVLREGLEGWLAALELLEAAARGEAEVLEALELAQVSNRLLVAVQKHSRRLLNTPG